MAHLLDSQSIRRKYNHKSKKQASSDDGVRAKPKGRPKKKIKPWMFMKGAIEKKALEEKEAEANAARAEANSAIAARLRSNNALSSSDDELYVPVELRKTPAQAAVRYRN